jgi:predicted ester cyclase
MQVNVRQATGGKVIEHWSVTDQLGMLAQLGLTAG